MMRLALCATMIAGSALAAQAQPQKIVVGSPSTTASGESPVRVLW